MTEPLAVRSERRFDGLCECGCGGAVSIAKATRTELGQVKGQPVRFILGHVNNLRAAIPLEDRFWSHVKKAGADECWEWQRPLTTHGYGQLWDRKRRQMIHAHRLSWEFANGSIPEGKQMDHLCRNRACVNPAHLEVVTSVENTRRGNATRLSWAIVREIRAATGSQTEIARRFGVARSHISAIRSNEKWWPDPRAALTAFDEATQEDMGA